MARTRGFDLDAALDQMVEVFWRKGYAATSINDLEEATRLNRTSLYAALGGKEAIFLEALKRYAARYNNHLMSALRDNLSAKRALTNYFDRQIKQIVDLRLPGGCLLANSVVECRQSKTAVEAHISTEFKRIEAAFFDTVRRGQESGEIDPAVDACRAARLLTAAAEGMTLLARSKYSEDALRDVAGAALSLLGIAYPGESGPTRAPPKPWLERAARASPRVRTGRP
jgi:TetR/AcrR family transcriptional regulator, transcriptional repressor for nem operon